MLATPDLRMKQVLWWICLLAAPLVLITIELFHPANFTTSPGMYEFLSHAEHYDPKYQALGYFGPEWWFALHMIQTPMVGLVAVGLWLMVDDVGAADGSAAMICAWLARAVIFVFAVYFTVLDAIGYNLATNTPEPATWTMLGFACAGLFAVKRKLRG